MEYAMIYVVVEVMENYNIQLPTRTTRTNVICAFSDKSDAEKYVDVQNRLGRSLTIHPVVLNPNTRNNFPEYIV